MNRRITRVALVAGGLILGAAAPALAQTATANLSVTATVTKNCSITTTPVAFGSYDPVVTNATTPLDGTARWS
jgi:spore coat protein U-like protein